KAEEEDGINVSRYDGFPIRDFDHWRDEKQTRLFVQAPEAGAEPQDLLYGTDLVSGPGYDGGLNAVWTPEGDALVITATENLDEAAHAVVQRHLYRVPVAGGEPQRITAGDDFSCTAAKFSPDGEFIYCYYQPINDWVYNHTEIARGRWNGAGIDGELEVLTAGFDRSVSGFDIAADGETIYFNATDQGRVRVFAMAADGSEITVLDADSRGVYGGVQAAGDAIVANWESS